MSGLNRGQEIVINPSHPFYGGVTGIFEFTAGDREDIMVFSRPLEAEEEIKTFFMIRPDDMFNHATNLHMMTNARKQQSLEQSILRAMADAPASTWKSKPKSSWRDLFKKKDKNDE